MSPKTAAIDKTANTNQGLRDPNAEKAPAANNKLSPGKNGANTTPVSTKIIKNKMR